MAYLRVDVILKLTNFIGVCPRRSKLSNANASANANATDDDADITRTTSIIAKSYPFLPKAQSGVFDFGLVSVAFGLGVQFIAVTIIICTDYVYDREVRLPSRISTHLSTRSIRVYLLIDLASPSA